MMKNLKDILRYVSPEESEGETTERNEDLSRRTRRWPISRRYMEAALQDICEYNDISEEQLVSAPETITNIEMFLYNFPHICCMSFFPNLVSLSLVQQNLLSIEGLHHCPHLELLRLSENSIQRIEGLGNCLKLKELFLHSNRVNRISGISHLTNLEVLWLSNNEIRCVEGLSDLRLKELSLARNPISQLGEVLNMKSLEFLNVAATNIGSFKEIGNLTRLKNLKDLRFSDPQWGDSPLALLHNYQTYVLFRLRQLQSVDTVDLTEEAKQAAKAMYTRKRVYYNMCIKSLQQSRKNSTNPSLKADIRKIKSLQKTLSKLIKTHKDLEKEMCEEPESELLRTSQAESNPQRSKEWWVQAKAKVNSIDQQISHVIKNLDHLRSQIHLGKAKDQAAMDLYIHWLMVELDTGGNIRMEVGNSKDVWFKSCMDLVMSRFFAADFVPFSITGMNVLKVARIHNRFLQDRFERILERHIQKGSKMHVEYLLYGETLQAPDELQWIIEEGFPFSLEHPRNASAGAVLLSNSVGLADMCRLQAIAEQSREASWRSNATGWLLVVKTCLGSSVRDLTHAYTKNPRLPITNGVRQTEGETTAPAKKASYPHADSVYRTHPQDPTQRSWSVLDASMVVPEYLVEFEYSFKEIDTSKLDHLPAIQKSGKLSKSAAATNGHHENVPLNDDEVDGNLQNTRSENEFPTSCDLICSTPRPQSGTGVVLSNEYLLKRNGLEGSFCHLSYLNLHNCNITGIDALRGLPSLKVLVLSFNKITQITGLDGLCMLERLDMSYNLLSRVEGLNGLNNLVILDLAGNAIWCPDDLTLLQLQVPRLLSINLRSNPLVDELGYHSLVLRALPLLAELDCEPVTTEERVAAMSRYAPQTAALSSTIAHSEIHVETPAIPLSLDEQDLDNAINFLTEPVTEILDGKVGTKTCERPGKVTHTAAATGGGHKQLADPFRLSPYRLNQFTKFHRIETTSKRRTVHSAKEGPAYYEGVEEVHLERRKLKSMYCFDKLPNLRRLFLSGNEISVIAGLDNCTMLEELILDDNLIKQVTGLSNLQALWRLDLGCNQLTSCIDVVNFISIEQLSIDHNNISSLKGIEELVSLMELYAQNNHISRMAEISCIRELPKLMVVNFSGNALCEARDYRPYTIYSLRKLKVLDGLNVESRELAEARNKYTGRLRREMVEDCLGHKKLELVEVLDLSEQKIRHCGDVFESAETFQKLRELNLNNNIISSIHPLRYLISLQILRLENNNLENGPLLRPSSPSTSPDTVHTESEGERQGKTINSVASTSTPSLQSLEVLELSGNSITSIISLQLSCFPLLKHLSLQDNKITKVDGLESLKNIEHLYLNHNCIKELDPGSFACLQTLRILHLGDNGLKTLVHLGGLVALESLDLTSNLLTPSRLGGFSSIDNLSSLPKLTKLWLNNNPMSRQNQYRNSVISRLEHLQQLDGREITQEERQEANAYATAKEPNTLVLDPNVLLESPPNSMSVGGQIKVPLKVTSLNFDTMWTSQATTNGLRGHGNQASTHSALCNSQKQSEQLDSRQAGCLVRKGIRGENKLLMLPFQTFLKNVSPGKERNNVNM